MILNPNKTTPLVVGRSRTVNPPHGDLVLSRVSICASPNLDILGVKFDSRLTLKNHVRGIVSRVSQRIGILRFVKHVCSLLLCICSPNPWVLFSGVTGDLLLNVIFSFSSARYVRWPGFALIRLSWGCVIDVMLLHCVCCTKLIWTRIVFVQWASASVSVRHTRAAAAANPLEFEISWCKTSQFARCFLLT